MAAGLLLAAPAAPAFPAGLPFGVNGDWDYVDLVKSSGGWRSSSWGDLPAAQLDSDGWPLADAKVVLFDARRNMPWNGPDPEAEQSDRSGVYRIAFDGQATLQADWPAAMRNVVYDPALNRTTAELVVPPFQWLLSIDLVGSKRQPGDPPGTGFRNLRVLRPGYPLEGTPLFTKGTVRALSLPFSVVRFLGPDATNDYQTWADEAQTQLVVTRWADRVRVTDAYAGGLPPKNTGGRQSRGHAWEHMIRLCNETHKDMWLNVPVSADDDYVTQLALLLRHGNEHTPGLRPSLRIYVEHSNEVWNDGFPQSGYSQVVADAAGLSRLQQHVKRSLEIAGIFKAVFGPRRFERRIRPVVMWQYKTQLDVFEALRGWQSQSGESVSDYVYGIGEANYYDPGDTSTVGSIFDTLRLGSDARRRDFLAWQAVAAYFGVEQVAYEGGPSLHAGRWGNWPMDNYAHTGASASRDPRIAASERHHFLANWFAIGGGTTCFFALRGSVSPWGNWFLVEDFERLDTPRMRGAAQILLSRRPPLSSGHLLPWRGGQSVTVDASQRTPDPWMPDLAPGSPLVLKHESAYPTHLVNLYLLRADGPGEVALRLFGRAEPGAEVHAILDGQDLGIVALPSGTDGWSAPLSLTVGRGLHGLLLSNRGSADAALAGGGASIELTRTAGGGRGSQPSAPTNVAVQVADGQATIGWAPVASAGSYRVMRATDPAGPFVTVATTSATTFGDRGLTNGTTYYYAIAAANALGQGASSPLVAATPVTPEAPGAPSVRVVRTTRTGDGYFPGGLAKLEWDPVPGAVRYEVWRFDNPYWPWGPPEQGWWHPVLTQKETTFGDANLTPGASYRYKVAAINGFGRTESPEVVADVPAEQEVPDVPTGLVATARAGAVRLRWAPVEFLTPTWWPPQYNVKRGTSPDGPFETIAGNSTATLVDTTVTPGVTYYYVVSAADGAGESGNSAAASATPH